MHPSVRVIGFVGGVALASACEAEDAAQPAPSVADAAADAGAIDAPTTPTAKPNVTTPDANVSEVAPPAFVAPYALPSAGQMVPIPTTGRNVAVDVKPAAHGKGSWQYALFQSYGGGAFGTDYSAGGAYVLAGSGGHNAAPCFGAAIFDFTTGTWSYLPNANGFDESRTEDLAPGETNGAPFRELTVSQGQMPSPGHNYVFAIMPPRSVLGGAKGAFLQTVGAAQTTSGSDSPQSHAIDLASGLWTRASTNLVSDVYSATPYTDTFASYDPTTKRVYYLLGDIANANKLAYLDLTDSTWKSAGSFSDPGGNGYVSTAWVDNERRLLLVIRGSGELWAFDLNDVASGPKKLNVTGTVPTDRVRWDLYPKADGGDGSFYTFSGRGPVYESEPWPKATLQALYKLTPPASDPFTNTWTFSTAPIAGGLTAEYVVDAGSGAHHYTRFFYVPALRTFAWIPNGTGAVELVKP